MVRRYIPAIILAVYITLASIYSIATPMFEAPDENYHFALIHWIAHNWDLPVQDPAYKTPWFQEGSQPPLYYLFSAVVARIIPTPYEAYPLAVNPHAQIGIGLARINHNFFVHTPTDSVPWNGIPLQFHLIRFLSVIMGAVTIYGVHRVARLSLPDSPGIALLAMGFTAFNPMFLFLSASINNDNLVTMLGTLAIWLTLLIVQQGFTWRHMGFLAVILALGSISKLSGLTLYVVAGSALIALLFKRRITWQQLIGAGLITIAAFMVLAAWWYVRNLQLYGDVTGLKMMIAIIEPRKELYTIGVMLNEMQGLRISFWALFGWFNVIGPDWFLILMDLLTGIALIGGIMWAWRILRDRQFDHLLPVGILGLQFLITFVSLINWTRQTPGTQGRLLFPAIAAIATLTALGWHMLLTWRTKRISQGLSFVPVALMAGVAILSPFLTIAPAYAPPPTVARLPDHVTAVNVRFDKISVLGFRMGDQPVYPGEALPVTIYYQGQPDSRDLSLYLTAFDQAGRLIGKIDSYPGGGNLNTGSFDPSVIYEDTYLLEITREINQPLQAAMEFGWWDLSTQERVNPVRDDGTALDSLILRGGSLLSYQPTPQPAIIQPAVFSGALRLNGFTFSPADGVIKSGDPLIVSLIWEGLTKVHEDFTVFVHLETPEGQPITQADAPPLSNTYPTSAWAVGHAFADEHVLRVSAPPGTYRVLIGLYRPTDFSRLPVDSGGDTVILQMPITVK
jgi:hypothetical protein